MYSEQNFEYPVVAGVPQAGLLRSMGELKADTMALDRVAALRADAFKLVDKVGYND